MLYDTLRDRLPMKAKWTYFQVSDTYQSLELPVVKKLKIYNLNVIGIILQYIPHSSFLHCCKFTLYAYKYWGFMKVNYSSIMEPNASGGIDAGIETLMRRMDRVLPGKPIRYLYIYFDGIDLSDD